MKKLLLPIVALLAFASVGFSQHCSECDPCHGHYYVCDSDLEQFQQDIGANCGAGSTFTYQTIAGC